MSYNSRVELLREEIDKLTEKLKVSEEVRLAQAAHIVRLIDDTIKAADADAEIMKKTKKQRRTP